MKQDSSIGPARQPMLIITLGSWASQVSIVLLYDCAERVMQQWALLLQYWTSMHD